MPGKYAKGARFERQVQDYLEADGWDVTRSAGSHSVKDLVAIKPSLEVFIAGTIPLVWFIQCKTNGRLKQEERDKLLELEKRLNIIPMLAYKVKGRIVLERIKSKQPTFHYKIIEGRFVKVVD